MNAAVRTSIITLGILGASVLGSRDADAACYTVYRGSGSAITYRAVVSPVDLSKTLHETVPLRFGQGATMVIAESADNCRPIEGGSTAETVPGMRTGVRAGRGPTRDAERYIESEARPIRSEVGGTP